jgi:uracil-DNA glycosylase family 4
MTDASETEAAARRSEPGADCPLCPRLVGYRQRNRIAEPGWFNAPVPSWGPRESPILVVGMAPGVKGANRTGRPFTGDHAGWLLYTTLVQFGLAQGTYAAAVDDGLTLTGCRIVNAVRCVPPANLPLPAEARTCNRFLAAEMEGMARLRGILALGRLAHEAVLRARGLRVAAYRFGHGSVHPLADDVLLADSYHVSRYNTNTRRLTTEMFEAAVRALLDGLADTGSAD